MCPEYIGVCFIVHQMRIITKKNIANLQRTPRQSHTQIVVYDERRLGSQSTPQTL